ncbi:UNVERIFIED_CONTAM: hypothetical protein FKN15_074197 [Acipenser sinensis]
MEEAPAERPKGREELARADGALRVDPLPVTKETTEAGPNSTTEGPAAAEVAEGAQEGPPTEHLPRAPPSSGSDTGPETCVAEEGAAETVPEAEAGSAEKELPLAPVSGEEADSAPEAGVGSADNAAPMQATPAEGPEGGEEPPNQKKSCLRLPSLAAMGVPALVLLQRGIRKHPLRQTWALRSPRLQWSPERRREGKNQRGQKVVPSR